MAQIIEHIPPDDLHPWRRNARTHSKAQVRQIADSIKTFGFTNPVLIDNDLRILAGHGRVEAAKLLGLATVPCLRLEHMTPEEKRAYVLADNKLALNAGWDEDLLAQELEELQGLEMDFDLEITGFTFGEIDTLIGDLHPEEPDAPADDTQVEEVPRRVAQGDVWQMGRHRLTCGDSLDPAVVAQLMEGSRAQMVFSDPPYNVPIDGHVGNSGKIQHREFAMASGEMSADDFTSFLRTAFSNMARVSEDGAIHFLCMDWRHMREMLDAGEAVYSELKNLIIWVKDNGGMGTFYRSRHELIFAFKVGTAPHINTFELGQGGRYRTNVWQYRGVNTLRKDRLAELKLHPTVKPVQMIADAIRDVSGRGDIVLDTFAGSGSTVVAAHKTGRRGYVCELDPIYCDRILKRWELFAQDEAEPVVCGWQPPKPQYLAAAE